MTHENRMRGYCPIHEMDRAHCGLACFDARMAFESSRRCLGAYWRDRSHGMLRRADYEQMAKATGGRWRKAV